ncbi:nucleotidyltransferase family protein [Flammeovirga sp. SubArs3]|uniref:nucleotidyltransferase family protein n=1 Tax=Flammeovirga sp. SubArs3 TaxID=2995316 RepID=UPI00248AB5BB|nr:nucleotidyltransferase family protein [Flammeovirga sp. SubArs3]
MCKATLILAAGGSKRLQRPKQLLVWNDYTLLEHCINKVTKTNTHTFVVTGAYQDQVHAVIDSTAAQPLHHKNWQNGLGSSISFGVNQIIQKLPEVQKIMVVLADMPLVSKSHLEALWKVSNQTNIIISQFQDIKGVPAIFDRSVFPQLLQLSGDEGAKSIIRENKKSIHIVASEQLFFDVDTEENYTELLNIR